VEAALHAPRVPKVPKLALIVGPAVKITKSTVGLTRSAAGSVTLIAAS
jgi:hypothetical protein